jgi:hypothetical protein
MVDNGRGELVEKDVEVVFDGEKVKFKSNDQGHIVGLVSNAATYNRLVNEIPEAYIPYAGGDNVPEKKVDTGPVKPDGAFVLESGDGEYFVLDDKTDDELRAFAADAGKWRPRLCPKSSRARICAAPSSTCWAASPRNSRAGLAPASPTRGG